MSTGDNDGRLEKSIADNIEYYEYSDFNNIQEIGNGAFGRVFRANWKTSDSIFALKSFNNVNNVEMSIKGVEKEVRFFKSFWLNKHLYLIDILWFMTTVTI